jgi:class 3 adenylate cyclase/tetratricopeptide (TPR) repeat protein
MKAMAGWTAESPAAYLPVDRLYALATGTALRDRAQGAALFADVSGFTALTATLARDLGPRRGSEEITRLLNSVFDAITDEIHRYGGSVISFGGDAITCWFDGDSGLRAAAAALAVQQAMAPFASLHLAIKVSVVAGPVRRLVVGDPQQQLIDVLAGATLDRLSWVEKRATAGKVVLDEATANALGGGLAISAWRTDAVTGERFAVVTGVTGPVAGMPWPALGKIQPEEDRLRPWLVPAVYARLRGGQGEFLAELRPVAVLFVHFTGIDYDADDQAGVKLDSFVRRAQNILATHGGTLLQLMFGDKGSTLYAAFGAPVAHEDDGERCATVALKLAALPASLGFINCIRIGVSQGVAHAGAYGGKARRTFGVLGEAVNLSARLMQAAAPGQILASQEVYQPLACTFAWQPQPDLQLKGADKPVIAYALLTEQPRSRRSALRSREEPPLIGRQRELALIEDRLDRAGHGQGQIVGIIAEAGLGKSRLAAEVVRQADRRGWRCYTGECSASDTFSGYFAWHPVWQQFFGIDPSWQPAAQFQALEAQLDFIDPGLTARLPLIGAAVNLTMEDNALTASFDARLRKTSLEALLVDCLRTRSHQRPVLILLEDCHWLDPLSHDLLDAIAQAITDLPVLVLITYRPLQLEHLREPRVTLAPHFSAVELETFSSDETQRLIELRLARTYGLESTVPVVLAQTIAQRAEGNPFFVEALVDFVIARGLDVQDNEALAKLDLPASLQSLILSRIDRLAESQRITLKVASIIGRVFDLATLAGYYPQLGTESGIRLDLETLSTARLTEQIADDPVLAFAFRHVLIQEVVYESLPFAQRAALHQRMGRYIEDAFAGQLEQHLDQLALHYCASENEAKKKEYLLKAGRHAQQIYANAAAIDYYRRALPLLAEEEQADVLLDLGKVLELVGHWQEAKSAYQQALEIVTRPGSDQPAGSCELAMGQLLRKQGHYADATASLARATVCFSQRDDRAGIAQVLHHQGTLAAQQGDLETAQELFEKSLTLRLELDDKINVANLTNNLGILARGRCDYAQARALYQSCLAIQEDTGNAWGKGNVLNNLGTLAAAQGDTAEARQHLEHALAIFRTIGDRWSIANILTGLGDVAVEEHQYNTACRYFTESIAINRELADRLALAHLLEALSYLAVIQERPEHALRLVGAAASLRSTLGAPLSPSEASRLNERLTPARAQLGAGPARSVEAEGKTLSLDDAIHLAIGQETRGL